MIADLALCAAVAASYKATPTIQVADIRLVITGNVVAIPGTVSLADIERDVDFWPRDSRQHPQLGECHEGCLAGAEGVFGRLLMAVPDMPYVVAGHSLGGGIAVLLAAMMTLAGHPPLRLVTFGAMRASIGNTIPGILSGVPGSHYRNSGEPVVNLPPWPYCEWRQRAQLGVAGLPRIEDHEISSYMAALSRSVEMAA